MKDTSWECDQCVDSFYPKDNECEDCNIPNCKTCEERESIDGVMYTECVLCDDSYNLVKGFVLGTKDTARDVCGWTESIDNCAKINQADRLICDVCENWYYFDSDEIKCLECSDQLSNCLTCNH